MSAVAARAEQVERVGLHTWQARPVPVATAVALIQVTPWHRRSSGVVDGVPFAQVPSGGGSVVRVWGRPELVGGGVL